MLGLLTTANLISRSPRFISNFKIFSDVFGFLATAIRTSVFLSFANLAKIDVLLLGCLATLSRIETDSLVANFVNISAGVLGFSAVAKSSKNFKFICFCFKLIIAASLTRLLLSFKNFSRSSSELLLF